MKTPALVFLAAFLALSASWGGFVLAPQLQLGLANQTKTVPAGDLYPGARPGVAAQGLAVYRANGCVYCHTQQVGQEAVRCDIILTDLGTNTAATLAALEKINSDLARQGEAISLPVTVVAVADMNAADVVTKALSVGGGKAQAEVVPLGPDIARGWGKRRTVAADFLFDYPVQLGQRRIGPDLANIGARQPDVNWQLRHLYAPRAEVEGSTMPAYRFLFEKRRIGAQPSPDALQLPPEFAPETGYEIVPTAKAHALAAYLVSLRSDAPLFEAPAPAPPAPPAPATPATPAAESPAPLAAVQ